VTLEQGTGIVHSAPAYGVDDFVSCRRYGMKDEQILAPVMGDGKYVSSLPFFGGMDIWSANAKIVEKIPRGGRAPAFGKAPAQLHALLAPQDAHHLPRHDPVFAGMDEVPGYKGVKPAETLRATALRGVEATRFYPSWGQARLHGMIANRPDWTLSRQRQWGVPMPFFLHKETGACTREPWSCSKQWRKSGAGRNRSLAAGRGRTIARRRIRAVRKGEGHARRLVRLGLHAPDRAERLACEGAQVSGRSLLEGSDQHRGWFHSSLLVSCMLNGRRLTTRCSRMGSSSTARVARCRSRLAT